MGMVLNIVFLLMINAIVGYAIAPTIGISGMQPAIVAFVNCQNQNTTLTDGVVQPVSTCGNGQGQYPINNLIFSTGILVVAAIGLGLINFPNPFIIFAALITALLTLWVGIPYQEFNLLPYPINFLITTALGFTLIIGIIDWYKGGRVL